MQHSLTEKILASPPKTLVTPAYDRSKTRVGMVHFGPGAFHRTHQAVYVDDILGMHPCWAICGVSLKSSKLRNVLQQQDNLYTLTLLTRKPTYRLIGSVREVLFGPESPSAVLARLESEAVKIVTATITEKGYCLTPDGDLDTSNNHILQDLANPSAPSTFVGYLVEGLRRRWATGIPPFIPLSCDNLAENGRKLKCAVVQYAQAVDPALASWIELEVPFPSTMVDSITPATDDELRARVARDLGISDGWPVMREPFAQWVIEDVFTSQDRPPWAEAGAIFTPNVRPYEEAKLKLLNGCHSALAYVGMLAGESTVAGSMRVPQIASYIERMMREEICPGLDAPEGMDLANYCEQIRNRFSNPSVGYPLSQIAWDGSQKIPIRLLRTIETNLANGTPIRLLSLAVAAWMRISVVAARSGIPISDPLRDRIIHIAGTATGDPKHDVRAFLSLSEMFPMHLRVNKQFQDDLVVAYRTHSTDNRETILAALQKATVR